MTDEEPLNDPARPNLVWARAPTVRPAWLQLLTHPVTIRTWAEMGGLTKIGEYVGLIHGSFGEGVGIPGTMGLIGCDQIHRGLKRPLYAHGVEIGGDVLIYVTVPPRNYVYKRNGRWAGAPTVEPPPAQSVFTTFVSLDRRLIDATLESVRKPPSQSVDGVVLYWEWTMAPEGRGSSSFIAGYEEQLL